MRGKPHSLPAGAMQRPLRHNSVAVSLVIQGDRCYSMIDGVRKDWAPWATTITPPVSVHSHHNDGDEQAMFLIVQDGGLFYHARAMGFEFVDPCCHRAAALYRSEIFRPKTSMPNDLVRRLAS